MREGVVAALLEVLERTDNFTFTHSYRVAQLAVPMGVALHLSEDDLETLRVSALLHDLGKAFIPAQILLKQDFLTEEEFAVMRKHSEYGAAIVGRIPGSPTSATSSWHTMNGRMALATLTVRLAQTSLWAHASWPWPTRSTPW